jgi:aminodeoxyfutalosine deaminase
MAFFRQKGPKDRHRTHADAAMNASPSHSTPGAIFRANAAAACDATGLIIRPASILAQVQSWPTLRILALGRPDEIDPHPAANSAQVLNFPNSILTPAFANAHTHLDLSHIGPQPHDPTRGFVPWVDMVRSRRHTDPPAIADSVRRGIDLSLASGVVAVGDIAGAPAGIPNLTPYRTLLDSPLRGVSYLEFFGIGTTIDRAKDRITAAVSEAAPTQTIHSLFQLGLQPHAPNTIDLRLYQWAVETAQRNNLPLATHLAETPEERDFIAHARGPQRQFLERMGIWHDSILDHIGQGRNPVRHLANILSQAHFTVAHVNDADDAAIEVLARTQTSIAYCPRASTYFGAETHFGPHRYQDMLRAGVNVALGTDSIINLPADPADSSRATLSTLDEARFLYHRDVTDPLTLLQMITLNAATSLHLHPSLFRLQTHHDIAGLLAIPCHPGRLPEFLHPFASCLGNSQSPLLL